MRASQITGEVITLKSESSASTSANRTSPPWLYSQTILAFRELPSILEVAYLVSSSSPVPRALASCHVSTSLHRRRSYRPTILQCPTPGTVPRHEYQRNCYTHSLVGCARRIMEDVFGAGCGALDGEYVSLPFLPPLFTPPSFISSLLPATHADAAEEKPAAPEAPAEHTIEERKEEEEDSRMCVLLYSEPVCPLTHSVIAIALPRTHSPLHPDALLRELSRDGGGCVRLFFCRGARR
ncbi:hypothetical protein DFH09DRAFT_1338357 [Mycena vulgaris]|nr:hypothetical protein DFH09DRAFT_1338357 [Mycena vulgaris]